MQGEISKSLYFIKSGLVKAVRKVCFLPRHNYYKNPENNTNLSQDEAREIFKIDPLDQTFGLDYKESQSGSSR